MQKSNDKTYGLVLLALMTAIIFVLAFTPFIGYIPLGFTRATIIHIPVIIGSILLGPKKGAILGAMFGVTSLINNTINPTVTSFVFSPFFAFQDFNGGTGAFFDCLFSAFGALVICFVPRILVGVVPYYADKLFSKLFSKFKAKEIISLPLAGLLGSMTNTLLVMNMIYLFFGKSYAAANGKAFEALYAFILSVIAINGVPEAIVAAVLTLAICKALRATVFKNKESKS